MDNLIKFINAFTEYIILFLVFIVVIAIAVTIGIVLRKSKNKKAGIDTDNQVAEKSDTE